MIQNPNEPVSVTGKKFGKNKLMQKKNKKEQNKVDTIAADSKLSSPNYDQTFSPALIKH